MSTPASPSRTINRDLDSTPRQRWTFLAIISLGLFVVAVDNSVLYTALPILREELHAGELSGLWVINMYPLVIVGLLLGTGTLGDKIGHRRLFLFGIAAFGIASLVAAFAPTVEWLILARGLLGVGGSAILPSTLALIRITFANERDFATAVGIWGAVALVGAACGPIVGGVLLHYFWWGSVFLINVPVALLTLVATVLLAPPNIPHPSKKWDGISSLYAMLCLSGLVMIIKEIAAPVHHWWVLLVAAPASALGAVLFARRQPRLPEPLLAMDVFRSRYFTGGVLAAVISTIGVSGIELLTVQRFQLVAGYTPLQAGILMAAFALMALPASVLGGMYLHKLGFRTILAGGFAISGVGLGVAVWGAMHGHLLLFLAALAISGVGAGLVWSVASTAIISSAPYHRGGMAGAVESVSYELGALFAVTIAGSLLGFFYARLVPPGVPLEPTAGVTAVDPAIRALADAAFDASYLRVLIVISLFAILGFILSAVCFRGNPTSPAALSPDTPNPQTVSADAA